MNENCKTLSCNEILFFLNVKHSCSREEKRSMTALVHDPRSRYLL
jgi:hypothetical protein